MPTLPTITSLTNLLTSNILRNTKSINAQTPDIPFLDLLLNGPHDKLYDIANTDGFDIADEVTIDACLWIYAWHRTTTLLLSSNNDPNRLPRPLITDLTQVEQIGITSLDVNEIKTTTTDLLIQNAYEARSKHHTELLQRLRNDGAEAALKWQSTRYGANSVLHALLAARTSLQTPDDDNINTNDNVLSFLSQQSQDINVLYDVVQWLKNQTNTKNDDVKDVNVAFHLLLNQQSFTTGHTAVHVAASTGNQNALLALFLWNASLDIYSYTQLTNKKDGTKGEPGGTPLMVAARHGHVTCVHLLLQAGTACRTIYDEWHRTARDVASENTILFKQDTYEYQFNVAQCAAILAVACNQAPPGPDPTRLNENRYPNEQREATWSLEKIIRPHRQKKDFIPTEKKSRIESKRRKQNEITNVKGELHISKGITGAPLRTRGDAEMDRLRCRPDWGCCAPYSPRRKQPQFKPQGWNEIYAIDREIVLAEGYYHQERENIEDGVVDEEKEEKEEKEERERKHRDINLMNNKVMQRARQIRKIDHNHLISLFGYAGSHQQVLNYIRKGNDNNAKINTNDMHPACFTLGAPRGDIVQSDYGYGTILHAAAHDGYGSISLLWSLHQLFYGGPLLLPSILKVRDHKGMTALHRAAASTCHAKYDKKKIQQQKKTNSSSKYQEEEEDENKDEYQITSSSDHALCLIQHGADIYSTVQLPVSFSSTSSSKNSICSGDTVLHLAARRGDASLCALLAHVSDFDGPDRSRSFRLATNSNNQTAADVAPTNSIAYLLVSQHEDAPIPKEFHVVQQCIKHKYRPPLPPTATSSTLKNNRPAASDRLIIIQDIQNKLKISRQEQEIALRNYTMQNKLVQDELIIHNKLIALHLRKSESKVLQQVERYKSKMKHRFLVNISSMTELEIEEKRKEGCGYDMRPINLIKQEKEKERVETNSILALEATHILDCLSSVQVDVLKKVNKANLMIAVRKYKAEKLKAEEKEEIDVNHQTNNDRLKVEMEMLQDWKPPECYTPQERAMATKQLKRIDEENDRLTATLELKLNVLRREESVLKGRLDEAMDKVELCDVLLKQVVVAGRTGETWRAYEKDMQIELRKYDDWKTRHLLREDVEGKKTEDVVVDEGKEKEFKWYSSDGESESEEDTVATRSYT